MRRPLIPVILVIAALLASYLWNPESAIVPDGGGKRGRSLPKMYIDGARSTYYGEDGQLENILEARRVEQYGKRSYALITEPRFYSHGQDENTWSASAAAGRYDLHRELLMLRRDVVLVHDQRGTRLEGSALDIQMNTNQAWSLKPVVITQGENRTTAAGMLAKLDEETLTLRPQVESIYAPQL